MYQEDFHLSHYRQFSPKLPPQHTENGRSLRFPPIRKVNLHGWPLNSGKPLSNIPNDVSEWCRTKVARGDWLIERSVWVQRSSMISYRSSQSTNYSEISSQDPLADSAVYWQDDKVVDMGSPYPRTVRFIPKREPGINLGRLTRYTYNL